MTRRPFHPGDRVRPYSKRTAPACGEVIGVEHLTPVICAVTVQWDEDPGNYHTWEAWALDHEDEPTASEEVSK